MKKLLPLLAFTLFSCSQQVQKCKRIDMIYNYLIVRELKSSKGVNYTKIDSLEKERDRKIKLYSKV